MRDLLVASGVASGTNPLAATSTPSTLIPETPMMSKQTYPAGLSYVGATRRATAWVRRFGTTQSRAVIAWNLAIIWLLVMFVVVTAWYAVTLLLFSWFVFPFRLIRRSHRKQEHIQKTQLATTPLEKTILREEAARLESLRNEFIALAAHELRTPLASVHGIAVTLDERGDMLPPAQLLQLRRMLREQTERMSRLIEQLLDLSRLDVTAISLAPERLDVRKKIDEVIDLLAPTKHEAVVIDVPPGLATTADPTAIDRILSNLLSNALRYGTPPLTIRAERRDRHFRLSVEDRGRGVDPEFVPRLFDRFTRSSPSGPVALGSGLGLAIARAYAQAHGGDIVYEPAQPHGARFELIIPASGD